MTTVTEVAKRILGAEDESAIEDGDLKRICAEPALAQRFARKLAEVARGMSPGREWTPEDLREVLEVAIHGTSQHSARLLEGRYFRKRLREQIHLADRYGDSFAILVITIARDLAPGVYSSVLDATTERLRRTDMVFLYRRRFAVVLPRMRDVGLEPMVERLQNLVAVGAGAAVVERIASLVYPDPEHPHTTHPDKRPAEPGDIQEAGRRVLDWAEDQLRDEPLG